MKSIYKFNLLFFFIIPLNLFSQNPEKTYEIKTDLYLPTYKILKVLYEFDLCNKENLTDSSEVYFSINLTEKNHYQILNITAGEKVVPNVSVKFDKLNISGALLFKNRIVILDMDPVQLEKLGFLFYKTDKEVNRLIKLDEYGTPICFSNYLVKNENLKLEHHSNNY